MEKGRRKGNEEVEREGEAAGGLTGKRCRDLDRVSSVSGGGGGGGVTTLHIRTTRVCW